MVGLNQNVFSFKFSNGNTGMFKIMEKAEAICRERNVDESKVYLVQLCIEELVTNALRYGCTDNTTVNVAVSLNIKEDGITIIIEDDAQPFDPLTEAPSPPDLTADIEQRTVGGLGIHMLKSMTQTMQYEYVNKHNRMILTF